LRAGPLAVPATTEEELSQRRNDRNEKSVGASTWASTPGNKPVKQFEKRCVRSAVARALFFGPGRCALAGSQRPQRRKKSSRNDATIQRKECGCIDLGINTWQQAGETI
jgi:hypothetical protein